MHIKILMCKTTLQLQPLKNGGDVGPASKTHGPLHASSIDRTRTHPIGYSDILISLVTMIDTQSGITSAAIELRTQHILATQLSKLQPTKLC